MISNVRIAAVGLAALAVSIAAGEAGAQTQDGWYVAGSATASFLDDSDGTVANAIGAGGVVIPTLVTTNAVEDGWGGSLAFGRSFGRFRAELEWGYSENDADSYSVVSPFSITLPQDGRNEFERLMVNGYVGLAPESRLRPYVGAGVGRANVRVVTVAPVAAAPTVFRRLIDDEDQVSAGQLMAGVSPSLTKRLDLTLQYRWFATEDVEGRDGRGERITRTISGHNIDVGLRLRF